jgi:hypothetical protein
LQETGDDSSPEPAADASVDNLAVADDLAVDDVAFNDADLAADAGEEDADISFEELLVELQAELQTYSKSELVKCLQDRGLSTDGAKKELVARLAEAVAEE